MAGLAGGRTDGLHYRPPCQRARPQARQAQDAEPDARQALGVRDPEGHRQARQVRVTIRRVDPRSRVGRPRRDLDEDWIGGSTYDTSMTVIEYDEEPLGVLVCDHLGRPLIARIKDP